VKSSVVDPVTSQRYRLVQSFGGGLSAAVGGGVILQGEVDGFATDFLHLVDSERVALKVNRTITKYAVNDFYQNAGTSPKMVYDVAGTLGWSPHNLLLQSAMGRVGFLSSSQGATVTGGQADPAGGTAALNVVITNPATGENVYHSTSGLVTGVVYTASAWCKGTLGQQIFFTPSSGVSASQVPVTFTGAWQRVTGSFAAAGALSFASFECFGRGGNASVPAVTFQCYGIQLNLGTTPLAYLPTTTTARVGLALDYDPVTHAAKGLLCEPAGTNLTSYSEDFSNAHWTKADVTIVPNATTAPDGTLTADKVMENSSTNQHVVYRSYSATAAPHTWSVFAKAAERNWFFIMGSDVGNIYAWFDLANGVVGTVQAGLTAFIKKDSNGWCRCEIRHTFAAPASPYFLMGVASGDNLTSNLGDPTKGLYIWGTQFEASAVATSYMPAVTLTTATRAADQVNVTPASINYSATAGSWWVDIDLNSTVAADRIIGQQAVGAPICTFTPTNNFIIYDLALIYSPTVVLTDPSKIAVAFANSDRAIAVNGGAVTTDTAVGSYCLTPGTAIGIGYNPGSGVDGINGYIRKLRYLPRRKTNAELVTETTPDPSADVAPVNTVAPVASGTATVGQTLSCTTGTWTGTPTPTYAYQWKRDGASIGSATASTYLLVSADAAALITCTVTATNAAGSASATSNSLGAVIWLPANTVAPVASGTATVGQTLSCTTGTWTGSPTPTYTYQWKRDGVSIGSATASTYLLVSADAAALITCTVTATNTAGAVSATSNSLGAVIWLPANTVAPVISGTVTVGQTLTSTTGTWTGSPTPTFTYQWKRDGSSIGSATASTYALVIADVAASITCTVTATNTAGAVSATSNSLGPVIAGAAELLVGETNGFASYFTYATNSQRVAKTVSGTITSYDPDSFFSNAAVIPKMIHDATGAWAWTPHNLFINSETPATQTFGTVIGQVYTVTVTGSGSLAGSAGATGTATQAAPLTFTATGTGATFTLSGSLSRIQANKGTTACAYLATAAVLRNGLAIDYDPVTLVCKGLLLEPTATNLLLNSATLSTQNVTVTAALHALSFYGTGTVTLTGVSTAGPLVGTGVNNRVSLQFTPTAGTLTLTVSGSVTFANLETNVNGFVTSWIPTFGATQARNGDSYSFLLSSIPSLGSAYSHYVRFSMQVVAGGSRFPFVVTDGSSNNFAGIFDTSSSVRLQVTNGGSTLGAITGPALIANTMTSAAARFATNDCALSVSGGAVGTDTVVALPTVDRVATGTSGNTASASFQFYIEKMVIVSRAWNDATLISKSST
jgi:hypothetical protein